MARYIVKALEKFVMETEYEVEAGSPEQAVVLCKTGQVAYDHSTPSDDNGEWIKTLDVRPAPRR